MSFYVCVEDGDESALYISRVLKFCMCGGTVKKRLYRRVTMTPGKKYKSKKSHWFSHSIKCDCSIYIHEKPAFNYAKLSFICGWTLWLKHKLWIGDRKWS